ncbi:MAG: hypothetical protein HC843_09275 [Sphingomonadales bacterium]|nr:hypothetical protein [Sphingomonadales bacterium]
MDQERQDSGPEKPSPSSEDDKPIGLIKPVQPAYTNLRGNWTSVDGESMQIEQQGSQLIIRAVGMANGVPISAQGTGSVDGKNAKWLIAANLNGNNLEMDCSARLTSAGNSLQGACDVLGRTVPFIYNR